jgi:ubiquinone/menaquinone biosynthesis C-methylase UbiE
MPQTGQSEVASGSPKNPIVEFFDRRAVDYDREYDDETPGGYALRIRRKKVLGLFDQPGGKVLDVGCGPGVMTQVLLDRGCAFWGVDPSSKMIEIARARFPDDERVHFALGDAQNLTQPSGFFDAVLCMGVIDSLKDPRQGIGEMLRVLRPGGTLIWTVTNLHSPYAWWKNFMFYPAVTAWQTLRAGVGLRGGKPSRIRSGSTRALFSRQATCNMAQSEGAEVLNTLGYYYNIFLSPLDEIMPATALAATKWMEEGRWNPPDFAAAGFIFKARKH